MILLHSSALILQNFLNKHLSFGAFKVVQFFKLPSKPQVYSNRGYLNLNYHLSKSNMMIPLFNTLLIASIITVNVFIS